VTISFSNNILHHRVSKYVSHWNKKQVIECTLLHDVPVIFIYFFLIFFLSHTHIFFFFFTSKTENKYIHQNVCTSGNVECYCWFSSISYLLPCETRLCFNTSVWSVALPTLYLQTGFFPSDTSSHHIHNNIRLKVQLHKIQHNRTEMVM
jgi:hypothetical protein